MPFSDSGEQVTDVLDFPWRDGRVSATRVDYEPGGSSEAHRHPAGAYVYVIDGSVVFGIDDDDPVVLKAGESFYEQPGALHAVSRNASEELPASLIAFFVLAEGESPTVHDGD
jgi:quercetin dioxygenase-like cupin family protein